MLRYTAAMTVLPPIDSEHHGQASASLTALVPTPGGGAVGVSADGEIVEWNAEEAISVLASQPVLVCHRRFTARRAAGAAGRRGAAAGKSLHSGLFDLLELFAFVRPAQFCVPTPRGVAVQLGINVPETPDDAALTLHLASRALLEELSEPAYPDRDETISAAKAMLATGWPWAPFVLDAMNARGGTPGNATGSAAGSTSDKAVRARLDIWSSLSEWEDLPPPPPPGAHPVEPDDARQRLRDLTGTNAEQRAQQADYSAAVTKAFRPREMTGAPQLLLAEAGTGTGKTLGYIAPASLWAEQNEGTVWLSTYTKNLQRQLDQELTRLYPDPREKDEKSVIRKGRENYLCLLNLEETAGGLLVGPQGAAAVLMARWARYSRDGDMVGGDFPAWLPGAMGAEALAAGLTDRRGECSYSACAHYKKCFIEKTVRKARRAKIVVANHALIMIQAALDHTLARPDLAPPTPDTAGGAEDDEPANLNARRHIVFDEGHHLFDAADSAFASYLSGREMSELRRWTRGAEESRRRRSRGLQDRLSDLLAGDNEGESLLDAATRAAAALPAAGWQQRINSEGAKGPAETFLATVRRVVRARCDAPDSPYSLECDLRPADEDLEQTAAALDVALAAMARSFSALADCLRRLMDEDNETLDSSTRTRMDAAIRGLDRRGRATLPAWRMMLADLMKDPKDEFVDWLSIDRIDGTDFDYGLHRHWVDPSKPFAEAVLQPLHGGLITSATLRDRTPVEGEEAEHAGWQTAEVRTGVVHLPTPVERAQFSSPFEYGKQARVIVVQDVNRNSADQVAAAYRDLFLASGGGGLGLFTAVNRLRAVHGRIIEPLEGAGLPVYAQHVDAIDTGTLVDIFRAEEPSCLLGTDAVRDGVDVPGPSLRLIVLDRTPWPRPDILYKARRTAFGGGRYTDMITRLRLQQAFGRLIRSASDKGLFVLLDNRLPTRLTTAFPEEIEVQRISLAEAISETRLFLAPS